MNAPDPVLTLLPGAFFALLFGIAAVHKLLSWRLFEQQVRDYRVLPRTLAAPAAALIPVAEALLAAGWLDERSRTFAALGSALLLATYAGAMGWNLRQGRDTIDCGCGGTDGTQVIRPALVARNLALAGMSLALSALSALSSLALSSTALPSAARPLGWLDWLTVDAGALALLGLYVALNQILANLPPQRVLD